MPHLNKALMLVSGPVEPPISSINQERLKGFTDFYFYQTPERAQRASYEKCVRDEKLRTVVFDEVVQFEDQEFTLHVLGTTPRSKPVVKLIKTLPTLQPVILLEALADVVDKTEGARILMHAAWHLENPTPRHNAKLDAFAVFMGEWAAKLKKVASR